MALKQGYDRTVITLPSLGIVLKFSNIHIILFVKQISRIVAEGMWKYLWHYFSWPAEYRGGARGRLVRGILANIGEFTFYQSTKNPFLVPTYFTLGIVNIQKYCNTIEMDEMSFARQMSQFMGDDIFSDSHHFIEQQNFTYDGNRLRIIDYGLKKGHKAIAKHGKHIMENFDPTKVF